MRFQKDYIYELNYTHNGVMLELDEKDEADFAVFFPIKFLTQSDLKYSLRFVYSHV